MSSLKQVVPVEFYNAEKGGGHPVVRTVGELIDQLQRLPRDLAIGNSESEAAMLTVPNIKDDIRPYGRPHLSIEVDDIDYLG